MLVFFRTLVLEAGILGISYFIPQYSVGCHYLSLSGIPASGTKVLVCIPGTVCEPNPCHHGGTCAIVLPHGLPKCTCPPAFMGAYCEGLYLRRHNASKRTAYLGSHERGLSQWQKTTCMRNVFSYWLTFSRNLGLYSLM